MELNIITLLYLFFRLAPFVIVSFFALSSLFNQDIKGLIYLVGLLLACFLTVLIGNSLNEEYTIGILANKGQLARDILGRIQKAYEYLPAWLQQGIMTWNKGSLELENGSKIFAYATSAGGVRGGTYNLIFLDEFAFVPHNMAVEFFTSTYPVISSGQTSKVIIVSTPNGLNLFYKMWTDAIEKRSTYKTVEVHWSMVPGRDALWKEETIRNTSEEQFRQEFECVDGDTIIEIYDKETKDEYRVRIKDFYEDLV